MKYDYHNWESIKDIPPDVLSLAMSAVFRFPNDPESIERLVKGVEDGLARLVEREHTRLMVAYIRAGSPDMPLKAVEKAVGFIQCISPYTVRDVIRERNAYRKAS